MARQNHGPLSRAKGKLGGVIYQQYEGMQISREYQPVVKNPQTTKQTENRAKFKLSSQLVAHFKEVFNARLSKLSIYTRMRRAAAVNAIYAAVDDSTPNTPQAVVDYVVAAINAKSTSAKAAPSFNYADSELRITAPDGDTVLYIICSYDGTKGELTNRTVSSFESSGAAQSVTSATPDRQIVMAVALTPSTEAGRASISNITTTSTAWQNEISRSVAAGDIEVSNMSSYIVEPRV